MPGKLNLQLLRTDWDTFQESEEILKAGLPILVTDKNRFYVGDGSTKVKNLKPANIYLSDEVDIVSTEGSIFINSPNLDIDLESEGSLTLLTTGNSLLGLFSKGEVYLESGYNSGGDNAWLLLVNGDIELNSDDNILLDSGADIKITAQDTVDIESSTDRINIDAHDSINIGCDDSIYLKARVSDINIEANDNVLIKADYNSSNHNYRNSIEVGSTGVNIVSSQSLDIDAPTINITQNSITASNPTLHIGSHSLEFIPAANNLRIIDSYSSSRIMLIANNSILAVYNNTPSLSDDIIRYKDIIGANALSGIRSTYWMDDQNISYSFHIGSYQSIAANTIYFVTE